MAFLVLAGFFFFPSFSSFVRRAVSVCFLKNRRGEAEAASVLKKSESVLKLNTLAFFNYVRWGSDINSTVCLLSFRWVGQKMCSGPHQI